jgi:hypothetical protein
MTISRRTLALGILALATAMVMACGSEGIPLQEDTSLSSKIQRLQREGGSAKLKDLTGGDWDRVIIFSEPVTREYVEEKVGAQIDMGQFFATKGQILVFSKGGEVQRAIFTVPNNLIDGDYSGNLRISTRQPPGSPILHLSDS